MITRKELLEWVESLDPESFVAIDEGGLTLIVIDKNLISAIGWLEVGGTPDDGSDD